MFSVVLNVELVCYARLNDLPYVINLFLSRENKKTSKTISLKGNVSLVAILPKEDGKYIVRLYNPNDFESAFTSTIGDETVDGVAQRYEIATVEFCNGKFNILNNKILA